MCNHRPTCPSATAPDHAAARAISTQAAQGWTLLCNGVVVFEDWGEVLPSGVAVPPQARVRIFGPILAA
jgi:hypothetical protein